VSHETCRRRRTINVFCTQEKEGTMPRTKTSKKTPTKRLPSEEVVPLTPELQQRFDELNIAAAIELSCTVCGQAHGVPKVVHQDIRLCIVCYQLMSHGQPETRTKIMKQAITGTLDRDHWQELRLPYFRDWLVSENRLKLPTSLHASEQAS
jgi:hypothetical protein